ncbi:MAG: LytTR family transcriptional regulator DNA-binding domain-containing protein [Chitinophagales bacterium]
MIKAIVIDDEPLARTIVLEYISAYPDMQVVAECNDGFEGVKAIQEHKPDLIFLDIQMPKINGFEMLELLDERPAVIFTTAFDEYALKAFEVHATDYLLKPFTKERFDAAITKWKNVRPAQSATDDLLETIAMQPTQNQRVVVKLKDKIKIIPFHEIHYLEAEGDYVMIHTQEGRYLKNKTMSFFEKNLDPTTFNRCHRSYIVNLTQITRIEVYDKDNHVAILRSGAKVPVSRNGYGKLKEMLGI